jgi:hypothetical protein
MSGEFGKSRNAFKTCFDMRGLQERTPAYNATALHSKLLLCFKEGKCLHVLN